MIKMELKNVFIFFVLHLTVVHLLDIPCESDPYEYQQSNLTCFVNQTIHVRPGEKLSLSAKNLNKKQTFILREPSTLSSFPSEIFKQLPSIETVRVINVSIDHLSKEQLKDAKTLKGLNLRSNKITIIPVGVISLAPELIMLHLGHNGITDIENGAFNSPTLRDLFLIQNKLTALKSGVFSGAPQLETIDVGSNAIEVIEEGVLDLPQLKEVVLLGNRLKTLPSNLLANAPNLERIYLGRNQLTEILTVLEKAPKLSIVVLDHNSALSDVNLISMHRLPQLTRLSLRNTSFTLPTSVIIDPPVLARLTDLDIANNNLNDSRLLSHLKGLSALKSLYVENNNFTKLNEFSDVKRFLPKLDKFCFYRNPWDCAWLELARGVSEGNMLWCDGTWPTC